MNPSGGIGDSSTIDVAFSVVVAVSGRGFGGSVPKDFVVLVAAVVAHADSAPRNVFMVSLCELLRRE